MLTKTNIRNFKCFDDLSLPLASMTLLSGFNAAGKSTALQSLLLLAQSYRSRSQLPEVPLNGSLVSLGTPGEVVNSGSGKISFAAEDDSSKVSWTLNSEDRARGLAMQIDHIAITDNSGPREYDNVQSVYSLLPTDCRSSSALDLTKRIGDLIYLSAARIGATETFPSPELSTPLYSDVGVYGEYAPWWFYQYLDEDIDELRCNVSDKAKTLRRQLNAWLSEVFPGAQANAQTIDRTSLMRLELRIGNTGEWRRPSNIGYGLSYVFPVIVAGLLARKGQLLIIDSPESHLHPRGQSRLGFFLSQIAAAGVQVLVETHSDHFLNGVRIAAKNSTINPSDIAIHFFDNGRPEIEPPLITSPMVDFKGNLSEWPVGFFDQSENDIAHLVDWS